MISYLRNAAEKLRDNFNSEVPKTADDLQSLKGVGPKVASLTMQMAWNMFVPCDLPTFCLQAYEAGSCQILKHWC